MAALIRAGTFSKDPILWGFDIPSSLVTHQRGNLVKLTDGKYYLDWVSGLGSSLLGHTPSFQRYIANVIKWGTSYSLASQLEYRVADKLVDKVGTRIWASSQEIGVRFGKTGTDVTSMAIRLARAVTGCYGILKLRDGYHGWADWSTARTEPAHGITPTEKMYTEEFDWGNLKSLDEARETLEIRLLKSGLKEAEYTNDKGQVVAAVIIEQPAYEPPEGFYEGVREFCDKNGIVLIMDEIVTGLRYAVGGASELFNVKPDLVCLGKSLGNGMPISALMGKMELMDWFRHEPVFCSSTMWGESLSLHAAEYVLKTWGEQHVAHIWKTGNSLMSALSNAGWETFGHGARVVTPFDDIYERAFFIHGMRERGILMNSRTSYPTYSHKQFDVEKTRVVAESTRKEMNALGKRKMKASVKDRLPKVLFGNR